MFDLIISGGTVYDGAGGMPRRADVGISGGGIAPRWMSFPASNHMNVSTLPEWQ